MQSMKRLSRKCGRGIRLEHVFAAQSLRVCAPTMSESISSSKRSSGAALTEFGSTDELVSYITSTNALDTTLSKRLAVQPNSLFQSYTSEGLDPLTILDPQQHSLGYLYFLQVDSTLFQWIIFVFLI